MQQPPRKQPLVRIVTATEAKNRFGDLIKGAYLRAEHLIVKRGGIPVVAIIPMADYERLMRAGEIPTPIAGEVANAVAEGYCQLNSKPTPTCGPSGERTSYSDQNWGKAGTIGPNARPNGETFAAHPLS